MKRTLLVLAVVLLTSSTGYAQERNSLVSGGYSYLREREARLHGWRVEATRFFGSGDVGGWPAIFGVTGCFHRHTGDGALDVAGAPNGRARSTVTRNAVLAGSRFMIFPIPLLFHAQAGYSRRTEEVTLGGRSLRVSSNSPALALGGSFGFPVGKRVVITPIQFDFLFTPGHEGAERSRRLSAGVSFFW